MARRDISEHPVHHFEQAGGSILKTVLLAGGLGSRLADESAPIPKPMVEVAGRPIIARIMEIYSHFGHSEFIVAAGYKSLLLKQFFANYHLIANNITVSLDSGTLTPSPSALAGWNVSVVETGVDTMASGRLRRLKNWLDGETFMVAYSDSLANVDIDKLLAFHRSHGKLATLTAVRPPARFGHVDIKGNRVEAVTDRVTTDAAWINGGFFIFEPDVLDYMVDDSQDLESGPLPQMARDGELMAYHHHGFWRSMDTLRDRETLDKLAAADVPPWLDFDGDEGSMPTAGELSRPPYVIKG
jgi:glucose-1-phosphate cytidylyltransferase